MKSVRLGVVFTGCLLAGVTALAAQQHAAASTQASSTASGQAQAAVALVSRQYIINQDVKVVGTKKPLPKNGTWGVRQAQESERVAECETAGAICREVLYHAGQPETVCGWTVLFPAAGEAARVVNLNDAAAMYMLRFFAADDLDRPKQIKGDTPERSPFAIIMAIHGTVALNLVVATTGKVQSLSVENSPNPNLRSAATSAVTYWQMEKFVLNGRPLPYQEKLSVEF